MQITRRCPFTGVVNTREIEVTEEQMEAWRTSVCIQNAMPNVSAEDREFIMTGITPEVWKETFGE